MIVVMLPSGENNEIMLIFCLNLLLEGSLTRLCALVPLDDYIPKPSSGWSIRHELPHDAVVLLTIVQFLLGRGGISVLLSRRGWLIRCALACRTLKMLWKALCVLWTTLRESSGREVDAPTSPLGQKWCR